MTQITIIDYIFQISLRKEVDKFTKGIGPQLNGIGRIYTRDELSI